MACTDCNCTLNRTRCANDPRGRGPRTVVGAYRWTFVGKRSLAILSSYRADVDDTLARRFEPAWVLSDAQRRENDEDKRDATGYSTHVRVPLFCLLNLK